MVKKPAPMECEQCGIPIEQVKVVEWLFLCNECAFVKERMLAIKEMDLDD